MNRAALLVVLTLATACDVTEPDNAHAEAPADAEDAIEWVAGEWAVRFDMAADYELPPFEWFEGDCLTWDFVSEPHDCTRGMYFESSALTDERIEILVGDELWNTTLAHELLHWALERTTGDLDPDHTGPEWNEVTAMRVELCEYLNPDKDCGSSETFAD